MQYHNFDIWVDEKDKASLEYHLRANIETFDSASGLMSIDPNSPEVNCILERFAQRDTDQQFLTTTGTLLFQAIFEMGDRRIYDLLQQCLGRFLPTANDGIRFRLRIEAPEIAALPWEFLYVPNKSAFLSTWISTPLVRYIDVGRPVPKLEIAPPIQMLVVIPSYPDLPNLNTVEEKKILLSALKGMQSHVKPTFMEGNVPLDRVEEALGENEFHIFHFIGHGDFDGDQGILRFTKETVNQDQLGQLFQNHEHMKLVVLNACKGAQVSPTKPFLGIAPQLVKKGVPAVVAMQYSIYDDVAVHFCRRFYQSLFKGKCRGKVDLALTQARNSLRVHYPEERAFGAPVLFLRSPRGVLFHRSLPRTILGILRKIPRLLVTNDAHRLEDTAHTYSHNKVAIEDSGIDAQTKMALIRDADDRIKQIHRILKYQSVAAALVVAFIMFCMSWVNLFDLAHLDTIMESYTMKLGDYFVHKQFTDDIVMIPIDEETEKKVGRQYKKPWAPWREDHAVLVDHLSEAGAKVIVFDIPFSSSPESLSDIAMRDAIVRAEKRGVSVIVGVAKFEEGEPNLVKELKDAAIAWGAMTIGKRGYMKLTPLVIRKAQVQEPVIGLALRTFAAYHDADKVEVMDFDPNQTQIIVRFDSGETETMKLRFFESDKIRKKRAAEPNDILDEGDILANMVVDRTPLSMIRDESRRYPYTDILEHSEPETLTQFQNKIVMVGVGIERLDYHGDRWGFEIHADAINTLLNGVAIRSVAPVEQLVLMVILGVLGATIRARTRHVSRRRGISLLITVLLVYFAGTIYLYTKYRLLLNTVYLVVSLFLTYWVVGKLERRYFKWECQSLISRGGSGG